MPIISTYLLYGAIAVCAFLLAEGLLYLFVDSRDGQRNVNRRMRMLSSGENSQDVYARLRRPPPEEWSHLGPVGDLFARLNRLLGQTGLTIATGRVVLMLVLLSVLTFFGILTFAYKQSALQFGAGTLLLGALFSVTVGIGGPLLYFMYLRAKRMKLFAEQLPDALDMMVRSLRVGHPVSVAITLSAKQMSDPIGSELGMAVDEMTYGLELQEALANLGDRINVPDFEFVVVAISIQHETGGNLAEVLNGLSVVIRSRFRMFKKIRALAAEGRFSAKILGVLPFAFAAFTYSAKPEYYLQVSDDPLFLQIMIGAVLLQGVGIFIMHKLINFRV